MNILKKVIIYAVFALNASCSNPLQHADYDILEINFTGKDTCVFFQDKKRSIYRKLIIMENSLKDTIICGDGVIPPGYTGEIMYLQIKDRKDIMIYFEPGDNIKELPRTDRICFHKYKNKGLRGKIKIKYFY